MSFFNKIQTIKRMANKGTVLPYLNYCKLIFKKNLKMFTLMGLLYSDTGSFKTRVRN